MKKIIEKQNPPFGENKICDICKSQIRAGIDSYYFIKEENKNGKFICLKCKNKFYPDD